MRSSAPDKTDPHSYLTAEFFPFATPEELTHLNGILSEMEQELRRIRGCQMTAEAHWVCECGWALHRIPLGRPNDEDGGVQHVLVCQNRHCQRYGQRFHEPAGSRVTLQYVA